MLFISCAHGLESLLIQELKELGIDGNEGFCGVFVPKKMEFVYRINYCSRIATRVLWPIARFRCPDKEALYKEAKRINWSSILNPRMTFAIDANVSHPKLRHSLYAAQVMKDALCDQIRERFKERPSVNLTTPDVQLNLFIQKEMGIISLDTSGEPLYKRGYRTEYSDAPIQETLAAALLRKVHYTKDDILLDPFCGSGTFLIEAAMIASQTPAGFYRKSWGFLKMEEFCKEEWEKCKTAADAKRVSLEKGFLFGADKERRAVATCLMHLKNAGFEQSIEIKRQEVKDYSPSVAPTLILTNPPYGKRLDVSSDFTPFLLKYKSTRTYFLTPLETEFKKIFAFKNGGINVSLYQAFV